MKQQIPKEVALQTIQSYREDIEPNVDKKTQTKRGRLFEMLADLTDDDGALAEIQDLGQAWLELLNGDDLEDG